MGTLVQTLASSSSTLSTYAAGLATHEGEAHAATGITAYAWLLVALPLLGAAVLLLGGRRTDTFGPLARRRCCLGAPSSSARSSSSRCSAAAPRTARTSVHLFDWIAAGAFNVERGAARRPAVHDLRAAHHLRRLADPRLLRSRTWSTTADRRRFFAYLNLFVAAMLLLVLADSYLLLFVGWEGVGLASYLLIGFWNYNPAYATAANKAFVANRVGDLGLIDRDQAHVLPLRRRRLRDGARRGAAATPTRAS